MSTATVDRIAVMLAELRDVRDRQAAELERTDRAIAALEPLASGGAMNGNGKHPKGKAHRSPREVRRIGVELTDAKWAKAVARCLKGDESVAKVARDVGVSYPTLWARVAAARKVNGKPAKPVKVVKSRHPDGRRVCKPCGEWTTEDPCEHCMEPA